MTGQLELELERPRTRDPRWFDNVGRPRWLLWCADGPRLGGRCPRGLDEPGERGLSPACCKQRQDPRE